MTIDNIFITKSNKINYFLSITILKTLGPNSMEKFMHALQFAAHKHRFQKRKDPEKTPYINHPIGVAHILSNEAGVTDFDILAVGRLI